MCKISSYIWNNLLDKGWGDYSVKEPSIEEILMLRELCNREIEEHFKENK